MGCRAEAPCPPWRGMRGAEPGLESRPGRPHSAESGVWVPAAGGRMRQGTAAVTTAPAPGGSGGGRQVRGREGGSFPNDDVQNLDGPGSGAATSVETAPLGSPHPGGHRA